jgi:TM2 domain-containing membrane protein YozV
MSIENYQGQPPVRVEPKNPAAAIALSFLIPGVGSMYAGNSSTGVVIVVLYLMSLVTCLALIGFVLVPIVWIWGMINAHGSAVRWNSEHGIIS